MTDSNWSNFFLKGPRAGFLFVRINHYSKFRNQYPG